MSKTGGKLFLDNKRMSVPTINTTPPGLEALYLACRNIYPNQPNPLQVSALVKYWLGGPDPLDYISMYANPGDTEMGIPPHWHYITFGLSNLHGDGRVHNITGPESVSGFGFELTFRLQQEAGESAPPTWPATLLQSLAKYVFHSGNSLCVGDHVSWHCALDNSESRIQHMLMAADPQLETTSTPFGTVTFIQVVGICKEELLSAQRWNGPGVLDIIRSLPGAGGLWLVTNMRRGESIFELDPAAQDEVDKGIEEDGSNLSGVSAHCTWSELNHLINAGERDFLLKEDIFLHSSLRCYPDTNHNQATQKERSSYSHLDATPVIRSLDGRHLKQEEYDFRRNEDSSNESAELLRIRYLDSLHLTFNLESGILLPLAIRGRVKHGRHFTFKSVLGDTVITLVAESVTGTFVNLNRPYVAHGSWLQILIPEDFIEEIAIALDILNNPDQISLPKSFLWTERKLAITIVSDGRFCAL